MQQLAIVHTEGISRRGEIKYFQIPLPGTVKKIIAIEGSAFQFTEASLPQPNPNPVIPPDPVPVNNCPNPGNAEFYAVTQASNAGGVDTQTFQIGPAVNPGFVYSCGVYSVVISVTAVDGDTPSSITGKLATAVNNTSLAAWNQFGGNTQNFKPTAIANGDLITLKVDSEHAFFTSGTGSCTAPPPPPPPAPTLLQYDPSFIISNSEKTGRVALQSPDATDIFYQCEVYREDKNIGYGDYTLMEETVGEWLKGRKRFATEVSIETESPILEAYYKDLWGHYYNKDINYQLNVIIWYEKQNL